MTTTYAMVHGSPGDGSIWTPLLRLAPPDIQTMFLPVLDHGEGPDAPDATLQTFEQNLVDSVSACEGPVVIVGHCLGAYLGARVLDTLGAGVLRLVSFGGYAFLSPAAVEQRLALADALESGALTPEATLATAFEMWLGAPPHPREARQILERLLDRTPPERMLRYIVDWRRPATGSRAAIRYRSDDLACARRSHDPLRLGVELAQRGSNAHLVTVEGDSHFLQLTQPELAARHVFGQSIRDSRRHLEAAW